MGNKGITRNVDNLGRIVLPKNYRERLEIKEGDSVNIEIERNKITIEKVETKCMFCGSTKELITFENRQICNKCCNKFLSQILIR